MKTVVGREEGVGIRRGVRKGKKERLRMECVCW